MNWGYPHLWKHPFLYHTLQLQTPRLRLHLELKPLGSVYTFWEGIWSTRNNSSISLSFAVHQYSSSTIYIISAYKSFSTIRGVICTSLYSTLWKIRLFTIFTDGDVLLTPSMTPDPHRPRCVTLSAADSLYFMKTMAFVVLATPNSHPPKPSENPCWIRGAW